MTFNSSNYQQILENIGKYGTKNVKMVAKFVLTDISKNNTLFSSSVRSVGSFNVVESDFAAITAEKNTMKRVSQETANKIFDSLVVFFVAKS